MAWCDLCKRHFPHDRALYQHEQNSANHRFARYICDMHGIGFDTAEGLRQHYIQSGDHYYCTLCSILFDDDDEYLEHGDDEHYACYTCIKIFATFDKLATHNECSHNYCRECNRHFQTPSNLRSHLDSSIHKPRSIACPGRKCGKGFTCISALISHAESGSCPSGITRATVNDYVARVDKKNVITNPARMIAGPGGTRYAPSEPEYLASERAWNGDGYECFLCHSEFAQLRALNAHLQSPRHRARIYRCPMAGCGMQYPALSALCQHVERGGCGVGQVRQVRDVMDGMVRGMRTITF